MAPLPYFVVSAVSPGRFGGTHDATLLIDPHAHGHVDELERRADGVFRVDQSGVRGFGAIVPLAGRGFSAGILRGGDNLKILALHFFVKFLPAWQIEAASSPGGPGDHQGFLPAKIRKVNDFALAIRHGEIGGDARGRDSFRVSTGISPKLHAREVESAT